jgi:hypothetical protein
MSEEWRPIKGFPDYYVSSLGRIGSRKRGDDLHVKALNRHRDGYLRVTFSSNGKKTCRSVHTCVAAAFLGPRPAGLDVRHLDGDHDNNRVTNLGYGTRSENVRDSIAHGTFVCNLPTQFRHSSELSAPTAKDPS